MQNKVVCIIQTRIGSSRLPGKVLKKIGNKTAVEHVVERIKRISAIDEVIIATTIEERDDAVEEEAKRIGVNYYRGSEDDVLSRYYYAAKEYSGDVIVRVTSDCPLIDSEVSGKIIEFFLSNMEKYDYVSNTLERTYPRGLDTEVFTLKALEKAFNEAESKRDREHVTPYIWDNPKLFRIYQYKEQVDNSNFRWTLDTEEDLELIRKVYDYLKGRGNEFTMEEVLGLYKKHPELRYINEAVEQKKV